MILNRIIAELALQVELDGYGCMLLDEDPLETRWIAVELQNNILLGTNQAYLTDAGRYFGEKMRNYDESHFHPLTTWYPKFCKKYIKETMEKLLNENL